MRVGMRVARLVLVCHLVDRSGDAERGALC